MGGGEHYVFKNIEKKPYNEDTEKRHTQVQLCGGSWPKHSELTHPKMLRKNCAGTKNSQSQLQLRTNLITLAYKFEFAVWKLIPK